MSGPSDADRALAARVRVALEAAVDRVLFAALNRVERAHRRERLNGLDRLTWARRDI